MKRRLFLQTTTAVAISPAGLLLADDGELPRTPWDHEGPFYPVGPRHATSDLIVGQPCEEALHLRGEVLTPDAAAVEGARVEIWQTDPLGRYRHPRDRSAGERWSDFLYWGEAETDAEGRFGFRTYVPGAYGGRPAHIHYKVWNNGRHLLTSQVYFRQTGGTRGLSRYPSRGDLQTVGLGEATAGLSAFVRVVV